jgi:hypothetical protein
MINIASTTAPQHHPFLPLTARQCRRRSPTDAPDAYRQHHHHEKNHCSANAERPLATLYPSQSSLIVIPITRQRTPASLKSP